MPGYEMQDLDAYVTDRALAGLFRTLGDEELKIRQDPAARTNRNHLVKHLPEGNIHPAALPFWKNQACRSS